MTGRRGARSGRGWDAIPSRPADDKTNERPSEGELRRDGTERGNVPARRRRSSPGDGSATGDGLPDGDGSSALPARSDHESSSDRGSSSDHGSSRDHGGSSDRGGSSDHGSSRDHGGSSDRGGSSDHGSSRDHGDDSDRGGNSGDGGNCGDGGNSGGPGGRRGGGVWAGVSTIGGSGSGSAGGFRGRRSKSPGGKWEAAAEGSDPAAGSAPEGRRSSPGGWGRSAQAPQSESERAREICLRQLAVRPRTRVELAKALAAKEISGEVIAEVLDRYDEVGIIDDAAFARAWVASRHQGRGLAKRALADELRRHGVEAEVAGEALEAIDDDAEAATARVLVDRKLRTATGAPDAVFRRLVGMLARKGYPAGVSIRAVKDALAARDAEAAEFADQIDADALADEATELQS